MQLYSPFENFELGFNVKQDFSRNAAERFDKQSQSLVLSFT